MSCHGTAFTLGDGATWKSICSGVHDDLDEKSAIASCTMFLLGYQAGAVEQARENNVPVLFCKSFNPNTLPNEFVAFVTSNIKFEKMDILSVLSEFTKGNECGI
ncbi:hypothetical protein L9G16_07035 [Shewanella sp. A25]|nr:hypothetical protein [Shewanella shenzhenensis]